MIPIVITQRGSKRIDFVTESLKKAGIERFRFFYGLNGAKSGLVATIKYGEDNPQNPESIGPKHIGCTMSHVMLWTALEMDESGADYWMIFEDDIVLRDGWREKVEQALRDVPNDWDILFAGSCCANGRVEEKVAENNTNSTQKIKKNGYDPNSRKKNNSADKKVQKKSEVFTERSFKQRAQE
jgi:GR25 family glycosyltransferase involved in LPS biosynthesis